MSIWPAINESAGVNDLSDAWRAVEFARIRREAALPKEPANPRFIIGQIYEKEDCLMMPLARVKTELWGVGYLAEATGIYAPIYFLKPDETGWRKSRRVKLL